jgi:hypothetical protein
MLEQESKNQHLREAKSQMWKHAVLDLGDAETDLGQQTDKLETAWTDTAGDNFVAKVRDTQSVLRQWTQNISSANPADKLDQINTLVPQALSLAKANQALFQQYMATQGGVAINLGYSADQLEAPYREPSGKLMDQIAALYEDAGHAVTTAGSGPTYRGVDDVPGGGGGPSPSVRGGGGGGGGPTGAVSASPGGGAPPGAVTDPLAGVSPETGIDGQNALTQPDPALTSPLGGGGGDLTTGADGGGGQDPTLSGGLGTAPTPSVTSPIGAGTGTGGLGAGGGGLGAGGGPSPIPSLSGGLGGTGGTGARLGGGTGGGGGGGGGGTGLGAMPTPITSIPGLGGGSGGGSGGGNGNGQGGGLGGTNGGGPVAGVRVPGVSLGGGAGIPGIGSAGGTGGGGIGGGGIGAVGGGAGTGQIPAAATPYQAPAAASPGGVAPTAPTTAGAASTAGGSGAGGGMGGMPMSPMGMGGMGGGGAPGSGAVTRPSGNNRNRRKEVVTPGLPVMLSGKAGMADMNAFAGRGRRQVQESDVPTTVQLIDEDLWQVEQKPAAEEQVVAPPVRRAH